MADPVTETSSLSQLMQTYYEKKMLTRLIPQLYLYKFGTTGIMYKPIPQNMGKSVVWSIYSNFGAATTALTEGTKPTGKGLSATNVSATVLQYGDFTEITDFVALTAIDPFIEKSASGLFADQAALTIDTLIRNELISGGTAQIARGKSNVTDLVLSDTFNTAEIRKAVRALERINAKPHDLTPGFFPFFAHPDCKYDLIGDTDTGGWLDVRKYTESKEKDIELNKIGDVYGAKGFMTSNVQQVSNSTTNVYYNNLMISKESFGVVEINGDSAKGATPKIIVHQPGSAGIYDPLNQKGSVGWKIDFISKTLRATGVRKMQCSASVTE